MSHTISRRDYQSSLWFLNGAPEKQRKGKEGEEGRRKSSTGPGFQIITSEFITTPFVVIHSETPKATTEPNQGVEADDRVLSKLPLAEIMRVNFWSMTLTRSKKEPLLSAWRWWMLEESQGREG